MSTFLSHAVQCRNVGGLQGVKVGRRFDQTGLHQGSHHRFAQTLHIHGVTAGKMGQGAQQLGRAVDVGAAQHRLVLIPDGRGTAGRTEVRQTEHRSALGMLGHTDHLGNDITGLAHHNGVADGHPFLVDKVLIMQGGTADRGAGKLHRVKHCRGGKGTGAAHLNHNFPQNGLFFFGRILERHRPAGIFGGASQLFPLCKVVNLHNCAINIKGVGIALLADGTHLFHRPGAVLHQPVGRNDPEALTFQIIQRLTVGGKGDSLGQLNVEHKNIQTPFGSNGGIFLPQGAGRRISGVFEGLFSGILLLPQDTQKAFHWHVDLAPDNETGQFIGQNQRNGAHRTQVFADIFAGDAVAAGGALPEHAVPVFQRNRKAVDFGLHRVGGVLHRFTHTAVKIHQCLLIKNILQRAQRNRMRNRIKGIFGMAAHPDRRAVGMTVLGILLLQIHQTVEHAVILVVLQLGGIQIVVQMAVILQLLIKSVHLFLNILAHCVSSFPGNLVKAFLL